MLTLEQSNVWQSSPAGEDASKAVASCTFSRAIGRSLRWLMQARPRCAVALRPRVSRRSHVGTPPGPTCAVCCFTALVAVWSQPGEQVSTRSGLSAPRDSAVLPGVDATRARRRSSNLALRHALEDRLLAAASSLVSCSGAGPVRQCRGRFMQSCTRHWWLSLSRPKHMLRRPEHGGDA